MLYFGWWSDSDRAFFSQPSADSTGCTGFREHSEFSALHVSNRLIDGDRYVPWNVGGL